MLPAFSVIVKLEVLVCVEVNEYVLFCTYEDRGYIALFDLVVNRSFGSFFQLCKFRSCDEGLLPVIYFTHNFSYTVVKYINFYFLPDYFCSALPIRAMVFWLLSVVHVVATMNASGILPCLLSVLQVASCPSMGFKP